MKSLFPSTMTPEQKTGFVLLFVFAIMAVGLGFLQMRNAIYNPFAIKKTKNQIISVSDDAVRLQSIDTDKDGLNDYEELQIHGTSPYLPDTDSDGVSDRDEIEKGSDPLCPEGKKCTEEVTPSTTGISTGTLFGNYYDPALGSDFLNSGSQISSSSELSNLNISDSDISNLNTLISDPNQIRTLLLQTGQITEEQLKLIDDETLLKMSQEVLQSLSGGGTTSPTGTSP